MMGRCHWIRNFSSEIRFNRIWVLKPSFLIESDWFFRSLLFSLSYLLYFSLSLSLLELNFPFTLDPSFHSVIVTFPKKEINSKNLFSSADLSKAPFHLVVFFTWNFQTCFFPHFNFSEVPRVPLARKHGAWRNSEWESLCKRKIRFLNPAPAKLSQRRGIK